MIRLSVAFRLNGAGVRFWLDVIGGEGERLETEENRSSL